MTFSPPLDDFTRVYEAGGAQLVFTRLVDDLETPVSAYLKIGAGQPYAFLFESVEGGAYRGRYSIIAMKPDLVWRCRGEASEIAHGEDIAAGRFTPQGGGALENLRDLVSACRLPMPAGVPPMAAGLFGALGYDMVRLVERLPNINPDPLDLPDGVLMRPSIVAVFDSIAHEIILATTVRAQAGGHLALLSANTRQQLRRSLRRYALDGPLQIQRAETLDEAQAFLAALGVLHQQTWTRRGRPGAFANPDFVAFHQALLATAWPRGEIDLLRVSFGTRALGYLYNFRWRGRIANYQTGFDYPTEPSTPLKPGLTCHHLAAEQYAAEGLDAYDLLAGESRYKSSLATNSETLHWIEMMPSLSLPGLLHRARAALARA